MCCVLCASCGVLLLFCIPLSPPSWWTVLVVLCHYLGFYLCLVLGVAPSLLSVILVVCLVFVALPFTCCGAYLFHVALLFPCCLAFSMLPCFF